MVAMPAGGTTTRGGVGQKLNGMSHLQVGDLRSQLHSIWMENRCCSCKLACGGRSQSSLSRLTAALYVKNRAAAVSSQFGGLGRLGQIELQKLFDHADFDEEALQQRLDINGDGVITKHEFLCALNERLAIFSLVRSRGAPRTTYSTSHLKHPYYSPFHPSF